MFQGSQEEFQQFMHDHQWKKRASKREQEGLYYFGHRKESSERFKSFIFVGEWDVPNPSCPMIRELLSDYIFRTIDCPELQRIANSLGMRATDL